MASKDEFRAIYKVLKRLTNLVAEIVKDPNDDQIPRRESRKKREFTPIGMSYDATFDYLHANGLITPIGTIREPEPEKRSPAWNPNNYCKYRQGKGHSTK